MEQRAARGGGRPARRGAAVLGARASWRTGRESDAERDGEGQRGLSWACEEGNVDAVEQLLDRGATVDERDDKGQTALMLAARHGHLDVVKCLLGRGADVNLHGGPSESTALAGGSGPNHAQSTAPVLERGARVDDLGGVNALMLACSKGSTEAAQVLLDHGADVDKGADDGVTALMRACKAGHIATAAMLLDRGAQIDLRDNHGRTAFMLACQAGHARIAGALLDRGAQLGLHDIDGESALILACERGHVTVAELLLDSRAQIGMRDDAGRSALSLASENEHAETVRLLRRRSARLGPDVLLAQACECGEMETVANLLNQGAYLDEQHDRGVTALMIASRRGHTEIAQLLLDRGAEKDLRDAAGNTALITACRHKNVDVIRLLLEREAQVNLQGGGGTTALMELCNGFGGLRSRPAFKSQDRSTLVYPDTSWTQEVVRLLLDRGAQVDLRDAAGDTALIMACKHQNQGVIRLLLEREAQVNLQGGGGTTALIALCSVENAEPSHDPSRTMLRTSATTSTHAPWIDETVRLLLDRGAQVNLGDAAGDTALITACKHQNHGVIRLLLEREAQVNLQGGGGTTALIALCNVEIAKPRHHRLLRRTPASMLMDDPRIVETVRLLLDRDAQVDLRDAAGDTALIMACKHQTANICELLLERAAQVNTQGDRGLTALMAVSQRGFARVARLLLDRDADKDLRDAAGDSALITACKHRNLDVIRLLLDRGAQVNLQGGDGTTALMALCSVGIAKPRYRRLLRRTSETASTDTPWIEDAVGLLLARGAQVDLHDAAGDTALILASKHQKSDAIRLLLERGAQVELQGDHGLTALLMAASKRGDADVAQLLLDRGAEIDVRDVAGDTALIAACKCQNPSVIRLLLELKAQVNLQGGGGTTALMALCSIAKPRHHRFWRRTPATTSMDGPWIDETVRLLLDRGAQVDLRDAAGDTALILACKHHKPDSIKLLLERGAQVDLQGGGGTTALMAVCDVGDNTEPRDRHASNRTMSASVPMDKAWNHEVARLLLDRHAQVDLCDNEGKTALMLASIRLHSANVRLLLARNAQVNLRDKEERTALMLVCNSSLSAQRAEEQTDPGQSDFELYMTSRRRSSHPDSREKERMREHALLTIEALVEGGAELDLKDADGNCALSLAVDTRNDVASKILVDRGATLHFSHIPDDTAQAALTIASRNGFIEVLELISKRVRVGVA